jgi:hypothetical protein
MLEGIELFVVERSLLGPEKSWIIELGELCCTVLNVYPYVTKNHPWREKKG